MTERKIALITGGSRGIGLACALELAKAGCDIIINDICDAEKAQPRFAQYGGNDAHNAASLPVYRLYIARRRCVLLGVLVTYRRVHTGGRAAVLRPAAHACPRARKGAYKGMRF